MLLQAFNLFIALLCEELFDRSVVIDVRHVNVLAHGLRH